MTLYEQAQKFRAELLRADKRAARQIVEAYAGPYKRISAEIERVSAKITTARATGLEVNQAWVYQEGRLRVLQGRVLDEIAKFAGEADIIIGGAIDLARTQGTADAGVLLDIALPEGLSVSPTSTPGAVQAVVPESVRLASGAVQQMAAVTQQGAAVGRLIQTIAPDAVAVVTDALVSGVAMGKNPKVIAREMRTALGGNLTRALTIARTETLRAYREASRSAFSSNDAVTGWVWTADLSNRTCSSCWAQHGSVHPMDEIMATHPRCRCSMVPKTRSWRELGFGDTPEAVQIEPGPAVFRKLPEADQRAILGDAKYRAYRAKEITLPDMVAKRESPVWGPSTSEAGLNAAKTNAAIRRQGGGGAPTAVRTPAPRPAPAAPAVELNLPSDTVRLFQASPKSMTQQMVRRDAGKAMDAVDDVLRLPKSRSGQPMEVMFDSGLDANGHYRLGTYERTGRYAESDIALSNNADVTTMIHEFGHYIEKELFDSLEFANTVSRDRNHPLRGWWDAVRRSQGMKDIAANPTVPRDYATYLMRTDEAWARSFAQWVALRSNRPGLLDEVLGHYSELRSAHGLNAQWDDPDDFAPIAQAFDDIFRRMGWLA